MVSRLPGSSGAWWTMMSQPANIICWEGVYLCDVLQRFSKKLFPIDPHGLSYLTLSTRTGAALFRVSRACLEKPFTKHILSKLDPEFFRIIYNFLSTLLLWIYLRSWSLILTNYVASQNTRNSDLHQATANGITFVLYSQVALDHFLNFRVSYVGHLWTHALEFLQTWLHSW